MLLDKNYQSFFNSTKDYKSNPNKYKNAPHPTEFRKKGGKFIFIFTNQQSKIKDGMHKISRYVVNYLVSNQITKLYIGYNEGWKQNVNLGKKTNQIFVSIPYAEMIRMIRYKAEDVGIEVVTHEESYTSKCDGLALEDIGKHDVYLGKRKHRGLFQSSTGKIINADVNGALNILRKNISDTDLITNLISNGCLYQPVKFNVI